MGVKWTANMTRYIFLRWLKCVRASKYRHSLWSLPEGNEGKLSLQLKLQHTLCYSDSESEGQDMSD